MENYRILIVEDEVLIAEDIRISLNELGYDISDICYDSENAMDSIYKSRPDMVILDINIRGSKNGIEIAEIINEKYQIPFIFLTSLSDRDTLEKAKKTRPKGYLTKPFKDKDLLTTIEMAIYNHSQEMNQKNITKVHVDAVAQPNLSDKEYEVLLDIISGCNNSQIASNHFISINTVKTHVKRIFQKINVTDRVTLVKKILS
ncbi:MAG: response regulator transcription factor [Saprospiraceae bacterium]|nr:response regulator transcription factor [Saprospiraceae bacterium]